jgi:hypothetical protein
MADFIDRGELRERIYSRFGRYSTKVIATVEEGRVMSDWAFLEPFLNAAPAVNRWIPCSERLPEQSGVYLAYFTFKDGTHATDIAYINTGCHLGSITHWMPLPEPPEKE